jgi:hypothetical protein
MQTWVSVQQVSPQSRSGAQQTASQHQPWTQAWFFAPEHTGGAAGSQQTPSVSLVQDSLVDGSGHSANRRLFEHLQTRCLHTPKQQSVADRQDLPSDLHSCATVSGNVRTTPNAASANAAAACVARRRDATARQKASKRAPSMVVRS